MTKPQYAPKAPKDARLCLNCRWRTADYKSDYCFPCARELGATTAVRPPRRMRVVHPRLPGF